MDCLSQSVFRKNSSNPIPFSNELLHALLAQACSSKWGWAGNLEKLMGS